MMSWNCEAIILLQKFISAVNESRSEVPGKNRQKFLIDSIDGNRSVKVSWKKVNRIV